MDRYTERTEGGVRLPLKRESPGDHVPYWCIEHGMYVHYLSGDAVNRLAAYEDTGLEPEVCAEYKKFEDEAVSKNVPFSRIVELMEAKSEGRLLVLPCKVGDRVYIIIDGKIYEGEVYHISYSDYYGKVTSAVRTKIDFLTASIGAAFEDFGKTAFLTREEAEAALEKEVTSDGQMRKLQIQR